MSRAHLSLPFRRPLRHTVVPVLFLVSGIAILSAQAVWTGPPPLLSAFDDPDYRTWLPDAEPSRATAQRLNELGFDSYEAGRLEEAAALWKAALTMNPANPWAHYNYAAVLSVFAAGFGDFDAPGDRLPDTVWEQDDFFDYRRIIVNHLKTAVALRPERRDRLQADPDFNSIRGLEEYRYILMGPDPSAEEVLRQAPDLYSLAPGAYMPNDLLSFTPDGRVTFLYDMSRYTWFPEIGDPVDESFRGNWTVDGDRLVITTDDGRTVTGVFEHRADSLGFITKRMLRLGDHGLYGDWDSHYWEGQDG